MNLYQLIESPHVVRAIERNELRPLLERLGFEFLCLEDAGIAWLEHRSSSFNSFRLVTRSGQIWKLRWWRRRNPRAIYASCGSVEICLTTPDGATAFVDYLALN
jgi:hypothetical protein